VKRTDLVFLVSVFGFAGVFSLMSLSKAVRVLPGTSDAAAPLGAAGEARDVDMERLRHLLRLDGLSDHEAEYYKKLPVTPERAKAELRPKPKRSNGSKDFRKLEGAARPGANDQ
jgi:hypothetical protein